MIIPIYQVDAFTSKVFGGNPAAVCPLQEWISDNLMQKIAQENNLSVTAFFVKNKNEFDIRWFTPLTELDLAGHPTLATAHVILKELDNNLEKIVFKTKIQDTLTVTHKDNLYFMDFPSRDPGSEKNMADIANALGKKPKELYKHRDAIAVYDCEEDIINISPSFDKLNKLEYPITIVTAPGNEVDFVSRVFAPKLGIPEDPVTGSAHCELIPYWFKSLKKKEMTAHQISKRGGKLYCTYNGDRVTIGGDAITFLRGKIEI